MANLPIEVKKINKYTVRSAFEFNDTVYKIYMLIIRQFLYLLFIYPIEWIICKKSVLSNKKYGYLKKYRDIYKGKRCFVIGTGPSLKRTNLQALDGEITIGVNSLCMWFDDSLMTTHFFISDSKALEKLENVMPKDAFISSCLKTKNRQDVEYFPVSRFNSFCYFYKKCSSDISVCSYDFNSVVMHAIQFAFYCGVDEIYLLGVDCNYTTEKLYAVDHGIRDSEKYRAQTGRLMIEDFKVIKKYADSIGVKIYNATAGGMLEVFERVNLDDVI